MSQLSRIKIVGRLVPVLLVAVALLFSSRLDIVLPTVASPARAAQAAQATGLQILPAPGAALSQEVYENTRDFVYMWWANGYRDSSAITHARTSRYGASFDFDASEATGEFLVRKLGPLRPGTAATAALTESNAVIERLPDAALSLTMTAGTTTYRVVGAHRGKASTNAPFRKPHFMVVESGRFFERRWIERLTFETGAPAKAQFEVAAWPDRLGLSFYVTPTATLARATISIRLKVGRMFDDLVSRGVAVALTDSASGGGFVMFKDLATSALSCSAATQECVVRLTQSNWQRDVERHVGLAIYPFHGNPADHVDRIVWSETSPMTVAATGPRGELLPTSYDALRGWNRVSLSGSQPAFGKVPAVSTFTVTNTTDTARVARLTFERIQTPFPAIVTTTAIITDEEAEPVGLPLQLSKNWHSDERSWRLAEDAAAPAHRFSAGDAGERAWIRLFTMLTVPARSQLRVRYVEIGGYWGGAPAAALAQLSLIGWGGHQLWDQSSLGALGESITFDPDQNLVECFMCDVRPMLVTKGGYDSFPPDSPQWEQDASGRSGFTNNIGAMDILHRRDVTGKRQYLSNMRVHRSRIGPNLTEATYAGQTPDGSIRTTATTQLFRSNDLVRLVLTLRHEIRSAIVARIKAPPSDAATTQPYRLAFFQLGTDEYNVSRFGKHAVGELGGITSSWNAPAPGDVARVYARTGIPLSGVRPWVSQHEGESREQAVHGENTYGAWANRGLVFRAYSARIGGIDRSVPLAAVYKTLHADGARGPVASSNMELSLPAGATQLVPNDFVQAKLVYLSVPQFARDYLPQLHPEYPDVPNQRLRDILASPGTENSWKLVHHEASEAVSRVRATVGVVEATFPIRVRTVEDFADVTIEGGIALTPVTFTNLTTYKGLVLEREIHGEWQRVDQSVGGTGVDFWQTDYNPATSLWELTFNVDLDHAGPGTPTARFRLRKAESP